MKILNIRFELSNPFDRWDYFKNLGSISGRLIKHKAWELEHSFYTSLIVDIDVNWQVRTSHAGITIAIGLLGYGVIFRIYDVRHWDHETDSWEKHEYD